MITKERLLRVGTRVRHLQARVFGVVVKVEHDTGQIIGPEVLYYVKWEDRQIPEPMRLSQLVVIG